MRSLLLVPLLVLSACCLPKPPGMSEGALRDEEGELRDEIKHLEAQVGPLRRPTEAAIQGALPPGTSMAMPGGHVGPVKIVWRGLHAGIRLVGVITPAQDSASSPANIKVARGGR